MPMQVILTQDVDNLGKAGEVVSVRPGYGRNYLVPQGLAMLATIDWVVEGEPQAFAKVAAAMGGNDVVTTYRRLVSASGIKVSLCGDGLELNRPELLAEQMALPVNSSMRNATVRRPSDADLLMLAERVYGLQ